MRGWDYSESVNLTTSDPIQDRCHREKCRYFHPPPHIKDRLVSAGKSFGAMMSNLHLIQTGSYPGNLPPVRHSTLLICILLYCMRLCTIRLLYCTILYCTVLYCIVLHCTMLRSIVLCCTVLYCIVLFCTVLDCIVLCCTVLCCTVCTV